MFFAVDFLFGQPFNNDATSRPLLIPRRAVSFARKCRVAGTCEKGVEYEKKSPPPPPPLPLPMRVTRRLSCKVIEDNKGRQTQSGASGAGLSFASEGRSGASAIKGATVRGARPANAILSKSSRRKRPRLMPQHKLRLIKGLLRLLRGDDGRMAAGMRRSSGKCGEHCVFTH